MEGITVLVGLLLGVLVFLLIWFGVTAARAARDVDELRGRFDDLQAEMRELRRETHERPTSSAPPPPPLERLAVEKPVESPPPFIQHPVAPPFVSPVSPPLPPLIHRVPVPITPPVIEPAIDWEQLLGVKLFAWIGGFILFLALVFFINYTFEHHLISPPLQVTGEYLLALAVLGGGLWLNRKAVPVLAQTLDATGVVGLYAVTFAAHSYYKLIGVMPAFAVMMLITAAAFFLAVQFDAQVIAILGLVGGFLTPVLVSTGTDNPLGLFSYVACLDAGLALVALRKRWSYLIALGVIGTALLQIAWVGEFFEPGKIMTALIVLGGFDALFLLVFLGAEQWQRSSGWITGSAIAMAFVPVGFAFYLLGYSKIAAGQPALYFGFLLLADLVFAVVAWRRPSAATAQVAGGGAVFLVLASWTAMFLTPELLNWALGVIFLFGALHAVFPVVLKRLRPDAVGTGWWQLFPLVSLGMVLVPMLRLPDVSWVVWVCVLVLDVLLFVLAVMSAAVLAMVGAIVLTMVVAAAWIFKIPVIDPPVTGLFGVIGGFAIFFFGISIWASRQMARSGKAPVGSTWLPVPVNLEAELPAMGATLPFLLLMLATGRLTLASSSPIFGLALLLVALLLAVVRLTGSDLPAAIALGCTCMLELVWRERFLNAATSYLSSTAYQLPILWHLVFYAVFTVFPFLFFRRLQGRPWPWAIAALAGPLQFCLLFPLVKQGWPGLQHCLGIIPAAFVIPSLAGFLALHKVPLDCPSRLENLAWFGGVTLFFVTLIFPVQFQRQWLTIAWGLEGAALLWLFHKLPHPGLRLVGAALLVTAFVRLALNPAVLAYHARAQMPILNWYLYAYGIVTISLLVGAWLLAPPRNLVLDVNLPPLLYTLGIVLAFMLMNIEIADFFTEPGALVLTFEFSNNFGRDMTYSIAWALFALSLLAVGIAKKQSAVRYASLGLLCVTVLKLFFHDFASLHQLYRIGACASVAIVLLAASFLYQKYVKPELKAP